MAVTTVRNDALTPSADLAQAGAVLNDATRLLDGGQGAGGNGGGQGTGSQGSGGGQTAQGGNQGDGCHSCGGHSGEHGHSGEQGHYGGQPVPSFWNFVENEHGHEGFGGRGHNQFELMWHHA